MKHNEPKYGKKKLIPLAIKNAKKPVIGGRKCSCKKCKHGGKLQPLSNFFRRSQVPDGYSYHCKDCDNERRNAYNEKKRQNINAFNNLF